MQKQFLVLVEDRPNDVDLTLRALKKNNIANEIVVLRDGDLRRIWGRKLPGEPIKNNNNNG